MPDIHIQFHAAPDELTEWVQEWARAHGIQVVAMYFPPVSFRQITVDEIPTAIADPAVSRISFLLQPFDPSIKYQTDFDDRYSHQMILQIGRLTPDGLGESWVACRTNDEEALKLWRKFAKDLNAKTKAGLTAIHRQTGESDLNKSHRYSEGAKRLEAGGVEILSIVGPGKGPMLRLGDVTKEATNEQST